MSGLATQKGDLLRHTKSIHEGVKFPCNQSDYKATQRGHLLNHIKSIHEGNREGKIIETYKIHT